MEGHAPGPRLIGSKHPVILQGPSSSWGLLPTKWALKSQGLSGSTKGSPGKLQE